VTSGGRVLAVTSLAATTAEALKLSYENIDKIGFDKKYYRKDVGRDLLPFEC
jgi:phosphoribosylamine--glycine ligase